MLPTGALDRALAKVERRRPDRGLLGREGGGMLRLHERLDLLELLRKRREPTRREGQLFDGFGLGVVQPSCCSP
jgi:hypothetical protein